MPRTIGGIFLKSFFYFRARGEFATIEFYKDRGEFETGDALKTYTLKTTKPYQAGWLNKKTCELLIYKGCLFFALNKLKLWK